MAASLPASPPFPSSPDQRLILTQSAHAPSLPDAPTTSKAPLHLEFPNEIQPDTTTTRLNHSNVPFNVPLKSRPPNTGRPDFWNDPRPTNENPNFVRDYFQSSRLHFIGSFRARYESMMVTVGHNLAINPGTLLHNSQVISQQASMRPANQRVIVHIDMDAFFAAVAVRDNPSLKDLPVAVCHAAGEISSCTYAAREFGVHAGMFLRDAKRLCPHLHTVEYDFDAYERVSIQIYSLFFKLPNVCVQAVSVDEAYLDFTLCNKPTEPPIETVVADLRNAIYAHTKCTASAGIGPSKLVARLATKSAKPNGQRYIKQHQVLNYMDTLSIRDLPGIGWRNAQKFADLNVKTVPQLRALPLNVLHERFGSKLGTDFHDLALGIDHSRIEPLRPRKSIGAELSWGVRFLNSETDKLSKFISDVCDEVAQRVSEAGAHGTKVTYKVYRRIPERSTKGYKHLGHGPCTIVSKSSRLPSKVTGTKLSIALREACLKMHKSLQLQPELFRGVGIQVVDLAFADLKFEHTVVNKSSARCINSFFKPASGPKKSLSDRAGSGADECVLENLSQDVLNAIDDDIQHENRTESSRVEHLTGENADQFGVAEFQKGGHQFVNNLNDVPNASKQNDIENNGFDADADRVESDDANVIEVEQASIDTKTDAERSVDMIIPEGWDRSVFQELPRNLQDELLQDSRSRDGAQPKTRRRHGNHIDNVRGRNVERGRGRKRKRGTLHHVANEFDRKAKRRKPAQITMTQFAEISELRKMGTEMLNPDEFRERPLRECVELLEDLKGRPGIAGIGRGRPGVNGLLVGNTKDGRLSKNTDDKDADIPSPPSLSSDSEIECGLDELLSRYGRMDTVVYAQEESWEYASQLELWLESTASNIRSAHVELLRGRLLELLQARQLERVCEEFRIFKRFLSKRTCRPWIKWYKILMEDVQTECLQIFQFRLSLPRVEDCKKKDNT